MQTMAGPQIPQNRMTADEFMVWYDQQPDGCRYELMDGRIYPNGIPRDPQEDARVTKRIAKSVEAQFYAQNMKAISGDRDSSGRPPESGPLESGGGACFALQETDDRSPNLQSIVAILIMLSEESRQHGYDLLAIYFRNPNVLHILIILPEQRGIIHHRRQGINKFATVICDAGKIILDSPKITLDLSEAFAEIE